MWQQARPKLPMVKVNQSLWGKVWEKKVLPVTLSWRRKCPVEISLFIKAQLARRDLGERIIYLRYHFQTPEERHNCLLNWIKLVGWSVVWSSVWSGGGVTSCQFGLHSGKVVCLQQQFQAENYSITWKHLCSLIHFTNKFVCMQLEFQCTIAN